MILNTMDCTFLSYFSTILRKRRLCLVMEGIRVWWQTFQHTDWVWPPCSWCADQSCRMKLTLDPQIEKTMYCLRCGVWKLGPHSKPCSHLETWASVISYLRTLTGTVLSRVERWSHLTLSLAFSQSWHGTAFHLVHTVERFSLVL